MLIYVGLFSVRIIRKKYGQSRSECFRNLGMDSEKIEQVDLDRIQLYSNKIAVLSIVSFMTSVYSNRRM